MRTTGTNGILLAASLALILLFLVLRDTEARRYDETNGSGELLRHHRHRHRHETSQPSQRWSGGSSNRQRPSSGNNDEDDDYEENYASDLDYEEYADDEDSEEDDRRTSRLHPPKRTGGNHYRYEGRHPAPRYHHRGGSSSHHAVNSRGHDRAGGHHRLNSRTGYRKHRYKDDEEDSLEADNYDKARPLPSRRRYEIGNDNDEEDDYNNEDSAENEPSGYYHNKHKGGSRKKITDLGAESKGRRSRYEPRKDWRYRVDDEEDDYAYDADDEAEESEEESRSRKRAPRKGRQHRDEAKSVTGNRRSAGAGSRFDEWLKRTRQTIHGNGSRNQEGGQQQPRRRASSREDEEEFQEDEPSRPDDEDDELEVWKDEEDRELDNDFYKNDEERSVNSPLKTYDDIIRRLTEERTTTSKAPVKRDYRNTEIESHLKRDAYGNLRLFDSRRNSSQRSVARHSNLVGGSGGNLAGGRKELAQATRKKSLQEEDEEEEDSEAETQADANTDYADDETEDDEVISITPSTTTTPKPPPPTIPPTTTTSTTTTTTTTTTPRPRYERPAPRRSYDSASTGSQYNGYQAKSDYPAMSAMSAFKWQALGTPERVKETRNSMAQYSQSSKSAEVHAAQSHAMRVAIEGSCRWPRAKVIPVRDIYANSTASYIPHCAILHRCSDDTGCCRSETLTCEAKHSQRVELYFYATYIHGKNEIEKLSFDNHTECECRERKDFSSFGDRLAETRAARHFMPSSAPQNIVRPTRKPCRCPTQFTSKITIDGVCECSCLEQDQSCLQLQRGKGYLSLKDRICIQDKLCSSPNCTFGEFITGQGRCPRKKDIFEATANHRPAFNYYHHHRRS